MINSSVKALLLFTIITGVIYPLLVTIFAQVFFPFSSNGSLYKEKETVIGSLLIGQNFKDSIYFHPRPSEIDYNPSPSGASNFCLTSVILKRKMELRADTFRKENLLSDSIPTPSEMLFSSASGVDPHITVQSAYLQINRISRARNLSSEKIRKVNHLLSEMAIFPKLFFTGEKIVNVLLLNIKLDEMDK